MQFIDMVTFQKAKLGDVLETLIDYRGKTPKKTSSGIPLITAKIVKGGFIEEPREFIAESDYESWMKRGFPQVGDVVLTTEAPLGEVAQIKNSKIALAQRIVTLRGKQGVLSSDYLKFFLKSPIGQARLQERGTGTTVLGIKQSELRQVEIDLPNFITQISISSVLSPYDDLIENNEKRIKSLEEMAQLLYTEWFVKFKFPGHERVKMVDSGTEYGMIPEGWEIIKIEDLLKTVKRKQKLQTNEYQKTGRFPIIDQGKTFFAGYTNQEEAIYDENLIVFGDHSRCVKYCNFSFACGADGTQLLKTNNLERMPQILLYYSVLNAGLQNYNYARHFKFLKALYVFQPDVEAVKKFDQIVDQWYDQIHQLRIFNIGIQEMRDLLIPQLVTGKRILKLIL